MREEQLISVILPIYNVKNYLKDCIESVRFQTYKNLEIILVDDGSTDGSSLICDQYLVIDKRIKVIHKKNGGLSDARNNGIKVSNGSYIALIDSDDLIAANFIEELYKQCVSTKSLISVCSYYKFSDKKKINRVNNSKETIVLSGRELVKQIYQGNAGQYGFVAWNKLYHRSLFNNIEYPLGRIYEDTFTTYKLLMNSKQVVLLNKQLYFYRIRSNSIMTSKYNFKKIKDGIDADSSVVEYFYNQKDIELLTYTSSFFCKETFYAYYKTVKKIENIFERKRSKQYIKKIYKKTWSYCKKSNMSHIYKFIFGIIYHFWSFF